MPGGCLEQCVEQHSETGSGLSRKVVSAGYRCLSQELEGEMVRSMAGVFATSAWLQSLILKSRAFEQRLLLQ